MNVVGSSDSRRRGLFELLIGGATASRRHRSPPVAARVLFARLAGITHGSLSITAPDGAVRVFGRGEPTVHVRLLTWKVVDAIAAHGDIGLADAWTRGDWHCDRLIDLLDLLVANRPVLEASFHGQGLARLIDRLRHLRHRNTRAGSKRNIQAHYDLGNTFYRVWLDDTMTYSSALFDGRADRSLAQAQRAKYQRILEQLAAPAGARVLEIGCGWGGFAQQALGKGLRIKGLTLSLEQQAYCRQRLPEALRDGDFDCALQDYRDEKGRYDGIVSIEMFEAVGEAYWDDYFSTLARCLAPKARAVVQTITIDDALFERYRRGSDFIQQTIFPGGMLPSIPRFEAHARRAGLVVIDRHAFGQDYARTLALWRESFIGSLAEIRRQGFDGRFERTWEFYLAYCEAAFRHRNTDVVQFTLCRG